MAVDRSLRESHFPAIEKRYGKPMKFWFAKMKAKSDSTYPEQMRFLQEDFGFSRSHANALIMYMKGSKSSRKFITFSDYLRDIDSVQAKTIRKIFRVIKAKYPSLDLVIAWNKPMLKNGDEYIFGVAAAKRHLLIAPWRPEVLQVLRKSLPDYQINKKTIRVPSDWEIDEKLLLQIIKLSLRK